MPSTPVFGPQPEELALPEAVTADPPRPVSPALHTQSWLDLAFLHWAVDPAQVAPLLPKGTVPDIFDGVTHLGLVAFRVEGAAFFRLPGVPYLGSFPETNVRLYSVDRQGRRGVVFRSMDASRLVPVTVARAAVRLPYLWSRMSVRRAGNTITYTSSRHRAPFRGAPAPAHSRIVLRIGEAVAEPSVLEHFLTARWGLHNRVLGRTHYLPNTHPRWPLHRAELVELDETLTGAAGLVRPPGPPVSVLYSPGVRAHFGRPLPVTG